MSQYPTPYYTPQPPGGYGDPSRQALAPCRRAGVLMIVYGILLCLGGTCIGAVFAFAPAAQVEQFIRQPGMPAEMTIEFARTGYTIIGILGAVVGIVFVVVAIFVRRGGRGAIITSIVLTILGVLLTGCNLVLGLSQGPIALIGAIPLLLTIWLLIWLFNANAAAGQWQAWQSQYAAQYYQHQQGQQAYPSQQPQNWQQPMPGQWAAPNSWPQQPPQAPPHQQWPPPPSTPT